MNFSDMFSIENVMGVEIGKDAFFNGSYDFRFKSSYSQVGSRYNNDVSQETFEGGYRIFELKTTQDHSSYGFSPFYSDDVSNGNPQLGSYGDCSFVDMCCGF
jgi:hypothetical protein